MDTPKERVRRLRESIKEMEKRGIPISSAARSWMDSPLWTFLLEEVDTEKLNEYDDRQR